MNPLDVTPDETRIIELLGQAAQLYAALPGSRNCDPHAFAAGIDAAMDNVGARATFRRLQRGAEILGGGRNN